MVQVNVGSIMSTQNVVGCQSIDNLIKEMERIASTIIFVQNNDNESEKSVHTQENVKDSEKDVLQNCTILYQKLLTGVSGGSRITTRDIRSFGRRRRPYYFR